MRRVFSTTLGQILLILACSSSATALLFIVLLSHHTPPAPPWPWQSAYRIASAVESLRAIPDAERSAVIATMQQPGLSLRLAQAASTCSMQTPDTRDLESVLKTELTGTVDISVRACAAQHSADAAIQVRVPLGSQTLEFQTVRNAVDPPRYSFPFYGALIFMCVGVAAMSAWAISRVIRPLRRLSEHADAFGRQMSVSPIAEEGPLEIRLAAHAFNLMQERITLSMQNRTRMLAAISHDLRTPLTRMRLQLEMEQSEYVRDKLIRNIELMQAMVTSALAFLSSGVDREEKEWLDLGALISTVCDEYEEAGSAVRYVGPEQIRFFCRPDAMRRALTNLIENALHFGSGVAVIASVDGQSVHIDVVDDGPGIPEDRLQDVIEPFVRIDPARGDRPGSVGLGLSIVREIIHAHGGTFMLVNRKPTGLIARIVLRSAQLEEAGRLTLGS
ncbi:TPA: HAMP domain-containing protein [Burkholderia multivorans]|uniref:ATP-binding protein n=1 Tax=Burkholderia multivorans TaxID=87883 RepID=UPI001C23133E|nr:ATP-binding protein [Burkholderia multivorans]MBU9348734.1 HAMP domain-containing protein [Burkholderia multivorans]MBU9391996.1 HAMP domain-containing protein [Burkholderia multivorans]HDR9834141.1 HAMP domain-containing protein [Burkholderia multivorans]HDR9839948.1 HAMP domain-containing protein [Burkholderia multivorans]HDR9846687.1 HAMP domain-containing protein [Burkholderia multivorans]